MYLSTYYKTLGSYAKISLIEDQSAVLSKQPFTGNNGVIGI
jgi:hypothetical protein